MSRRSDTASATRPATSTPRTSCTRITCCTWCRVPRRTRNASSTRSRSFPMPPARERARCFRQSDDPRRAGAAASRAQRGVAAWRSKCITRPGGAARRPPSPGKRCAIRSPIAARGRRAISSMPRVSGTNRRTCASSRSFTDYSADCFPAGEPMLRCAEALSTKLHRDIKYAPGETTISTSADRSAGETPRRLPGLRAPDDLLPALARPAGALRERLSAHQRARPKDGEKLVGDAASHAWVAVWSPPYGWVEFDPTNGCFAGLDHIAVAWGRDFGDVSPLRGVILGGADHQLAVTVLVEPTGFSVACQASARKRT